MPNRKPQPDRRLFLWSLRGLFLLIFMLGLGLAALELVRPGYVQKRLSIAYLDVMPASWVRQIAGVYQQIRGVPEPGVYEQHVVNLSDFRPAAGSLPPDITQVPLIPANADWKYLETAPGRGWETLSFDDSTWKIGQRKAAAQMEPVSLTSNAAMTMYFRQTFFIENPSVYRALDFELLRDDGAVVYLNGVEVFRSNLPAGEITAQTPALTTVLGKNEQMAYHQMVDAALLQPGRNVIAVELHQAENADLDAHFDLVVRGALLPASIRFAVIGDYGIAGKDEKAVADLVKGWNPDLIITTGDNNYPDGAADSIDKNVGQYYQGFISPYQGKYGVGAKQNRFFPTLGNHDWVEEADSLWSLQPYLDYFTLPEGQGSERYYDFQWGPVQFFALSTDPKEPDGISSTSAQAQWLQNNLQQSDAPWKLVYMHHPPFSSSSVHPSTGATDWPFAEWGASLVMAGHDHFYERIERKTVPYLINGLGGGELYTFDHPIDGSQVRFTGLHGAMLVQAGPCFMQAWFISVDGAIEDHFQLKNAAPACSP